MTTLITGQIVDSTRVAPLAADEALIFSELHTEGFLSSGYVATTTPNFVGLSEIADLEKLEAALWRLPLVAQGVMTLSFHDLRQLPTDKTGHSDAQR